MIVKIRNAARFTTTTVLPQGGNHKGQSHADQKADNRENRRADDYAAEGFAYPHGGQRRENQQTGNQQAPIIRMPSTMVTAVRNASSML